MVVQTQSILVRLAYLIFLIQIKILMTSSMEYTTSIAVMTKLLIMEKDLIENLSDYVKLMQQKMDTINLALSTLRLEHSKQSDDPEVFLSNPLNSFALMRRMHLDWNKYHEYMNDPVGQDKIDFFESFRDKLPNAEDYKEAQTGFLRLQETYNMDENDMARGFLHGTQYDVKLSVLDCFAMGKFLDKKKAYKKALKWFRVALKYYDESFVNMYKILGVTLADIWHMIADQLTDENTEALDAINRALALRPNDEIFKKYKRDLVNFFNHERLCNEGKNTTGKHLFCRYNSSTHPYFKLGPLKMEEIALDPYMTIYHNFMHDNEMMELRNIALPIMQQGIVDDDAPPRATNAFIYYIYDNISITVNRISKRLDIMTGLDAENYEMAVFNYGIGGQHYCHSDHHKNVDKIHPMTGNRKMIVLLYLEDNLDGGTVVFPSLDIAVPPKKGLALVFSTLNNEGNPEERTMHASCPVIFGSKWAFIKVYQEFPQMFRLPCYERNKL